MCLRISLPPSWYRCLRNGWLSKIGTSHSQVAQEVRTLIPATSISNTEWNSLCYQSYHGQHRTGITWLARALAFTRNFEPPNTMPTTKPLFIKGRSKGRRKGKRRGRRRRDRQSPFIENHCPSLTRTHQSTSIKLSERRQQDESASVADVVTRKRKTSSSDDPLERKSVEYAPPSDTEYSLPVTLSLLKKVRFISPTIFPPLLFTVV
jgi:hypothetical protein